MKILGIDNKIYSWNFTKSTAQSTNASKLHLRARAILDKMFPFDIVYEEVTLPGIRSTINTRPLYADFYIHSPRIMIEVQGEQHYKFVPFFHTNRTEYFRAKKLDALKQEWCAINEICLVPLPYNESDEQWEERIRNRT